MTDVPTTPSDEIQDTGRAGRRGRGGAEARRALRRGGGLQQLKYISRKIPLYEVLKTDGLELIEHNAATVLEEIGLEFRDDEETLELW
uniref:trimethylamine methyltransferase family protein n=1 Tax=Inquilinus sp. TaxID=1932117 RepID=UPI0037841DB0